eukprot:TRINITY_DN33225_c0_g1_i1.p2 TRINITY_DN33225_c0_g1~~TRINITY_DN33225_c0_g1_i1.p2  ORF type:complete len:126 (+),score=35.84 TRINITY_DN33225_c0_g1_i1:60-437(+)
MPPAVAAATPLALRSLVSSLSVQANGSLAGPLSQQVRCRQWLAPLATKGFRPERFEHMGQAMQFARESKRIPIWKLGWAANISKNYLLMVEKGDATLPPVQRREIERLLGVPLKKQSRSKIDRAP